MAVGVTWIELVVAPVLHRMEPEQLAAVKVMDSPPQLVVLEAVIVGT